MTFRAKISGKRFPTLAAPRWRNQSIQIDEKIILIYCPRAKILTENFKLTLISSHWIGTNSLWASCYCSSSALKEALIFNKAQLNSAATVVSTSTFAFPVRNHSRRKRKIFFWWARIHPSNLRLSRRVVLRLKWKTSGIIDFGELE